MFRDHVLVRMSQHKLLLDILHIFYYSNSFPASLKLAVLGPTILLLPAFLVNLLFLQARIREVQFLQVDIALSWLWRDMVLAS